MSEVIEKKVGDKVIKYKIIETQIDGNNTVKRSLVPYETGEMDIPEGSTLLDENETIGLLAKQAKPDNLLVGDMVRLKKGDNSKVGTIKGKLKSGLYTVRWEDNTSDRYEGSQLQKMY